MIRSRKLHLELPPEVFALWREARKALAEERGGEVSDAELVEAMCRRVLDPGTGSEGPAHQIAYKQCGECRRTTQNGAGREIDVAPEVFERAACDASNLGSLDASVPDRTTTTVTPRVRQQVFARDNFLCRVPGCRSARNLEVHHVHHQADGGTHELSNLCLLCSGHHTALHAGLLTMRGEAPHMIRFEWRAWSPLPPALSAEQREAMVRDRLRERLGSPPESEQDRLDEQLEQELCERRRRPSHATAEPGRPAGRDRVAA